MKVSDNDITGMGWDGRLVFYETVIRLIGVNILAEAARANNKILIITVDDNNVSPQVNACEEKLRNKHKVFISKVAVWDELVDDDWKRMNGSIWC